MHSSDRQPIDQDDLDSYPESPSKKRRDPLSKHLLPKNSLLVYMLFSILGILFLFMRSKTVQQVSCIVLTYGGMDQVIKSFRSFEDTNTYPFEKIVVVYDGYSSDEFEDWVEDYDNEGRYEFMATGGKYGEIYALDLAIKRIQTPFFFLSSGLWNYTKKGFVERALQELKMNPRVSQVTVRKLEGVENLNVTLLQSLAVGFSLLPSVHRLQNYKMLQKSYSQLTGNLSLHSSAGDLEYLISMFYLQKGFNILSLNQSYVEPMKQDNPQYKPYRYTRKYVYKRSWETTPEQKNQCEISLKLDKYFVKRHGLKRHMKKQLAKQIALNGSSVKMMWEDYGLGKDLQVGSALDQFQIRKMKNYDNIVFYFTKSLYYEEIRYDGARNPQSPPSILSISSFKSQQQIQTYIQNNPITPKAAQSNPSLKLALNLLQSPGDPLLKQAEYFSHSFHHKLDSIKKQLKLCLFIEGFNLFARSSLLKLFESINAQNYSNFQLVYVSDQNQESSAGRVKESLEYYYPRLINRFVLAVTNEDVLGTAGNHYMHAKRYCEGTDVVVTLNGDGELIGSQAFNVINAVYHNVSTWVAMFPSILKKQQLYTLQDPPKSVHSLRSQAYPTDPFLVTFRYPLLPKVPFEHVIQFQYNRETSYLKPAFYHTESNVFHVYSLVEMSGGKRVRFLDEPLYYYRRLGDNGVKCFGGKEDWTRAKAAIKYPMMELKSLEDSPSMDESSPAPSQQLMQKLKSAYKTYQQCLKAQKNKEFKLQVEPEKQPVSSYLPSLIKQMKSPDYYFSDLEIELKEGLPFCLVVGEDRGNEHLLIVESIKNQGYANYRVIVLGDSGLVDGDITAVKEEVEKKGERVYTILTNQHNYYRYRYILQAICEQNSLILFVNSPLAPNTLSTLNEIHQYQNVWMTYSLTPEYVQIHSFYLRVYELLDSNDYHHSNMFYLKKNDQQLQCLAMLELCRKFSARLGEGQKGGGEIVEEKKSGGMDYLRARFDSTKVYLRHPYDRLLTLSQDYYIDIQHYEQRLSRFQQGTDYEYTPFINSYLTKNDLLQAVEYEQIPYLPANHYLNFREHAHLDKVYEIEKYSSGEYKDKLINFCVTVYGRNNTENNRYANNLKTLLMQDYPNYHIVFIDDVSDDSTLQNSIDYVKRSNFPKERITFVKNLQRRFATYNIINSAFNYCNEEDVQVRIDGDDLIIGKQVLKLFNAFYQKYPQAWVVYSNFKSSFYTYGMSSEIVKDEDMLNCAGRRRRFHFIAPLTTWRIKLIRSIPLKNHQLEYGGWLNTLYDDALQFAFFQLSGAARIKYIPYISYGYNTGYGSNDNSDKEKIKDRISIFEYVVNMDSLPAMKDINERYQNPEVAQLLKADEGIMYQTVPF